MKFQKRTSAPGTNEACYYGNKNTMVNYGYGLPNCTTYVHGRWAELGADESKLCLGDAKLYYNYNDGFKRSQTPKAGAIACYNGGQYGHVLIVEEVYDNGTMLISESDYVQKIVFRTKVIGQKENVYGYALQGFILFPIEFEENTKPVEPTSNKYKIGDRVIFSSYYASSTDDIEKAYLPNENITGTITNINEGSRNPYLIDNGRCWVNDGDIRGYAEEQKPQSNKYEVGQIVVYSSCYRGNNDVPPNYIDCIQTYGAWQQDAIKEIVGGKNPYKLNNGLFVNEGDIREVK